MTNHLSEAMIYWLNLALARIASPSQATVMARWRWCARGGRKAFPRVRVAWWLSIHG